jgi:hypothetical protein
MKALRTRRKLCTTGNKGAAQQANATVDGGGESVKLIKGRMQK